MLDVNLDGIEFTTALSSLGTVVLVARNKRLIRLDIVPEDGIKVRKSLFTRYPGAEENDASFRPVLRSLDRYLRGEKLEFEVQVDLDDLGVFTRMVLEEVSRIPYGRTMTYSGVGRAIGHPRGARAVGQALGRNPVPIIVPCHRVVRSDGSLGGFEMGLEMKIRLLSIEGVHVDRSRTSPVLS